MKVCVNGLPLLAPMSGIGQYIAQLYSEISSLGVECNFYYGLGWSRRVCFEGDYYLSISHKRLIKYWVTRKIYGMARKGLFRYSQELKGSDIYHEPNFLPYTSRCPTIITVHDLSPFRLPSCHRQSWVKTFQKRLPIAIEAASAILAISDFTKREIIAYFPEAKSKVYTTPLGVSSEFSPLNEYQCSNVITLYSLEYSSYILAVGTLEPRKNLISVIHAFSCLPESVRSRFPLIVVGSTGWDQDELFLFALPYVKKGQVRFMGYMSDEHIKVLYSGAKVLVYPSLYEGFGLPPLEAMACGIPVITSNRASLPEVVGDAGIQVEALDVDALRMALQEVLEDKELCERLGRLGVQRAATFTWRRTAVETLDVFNRVQAS